MRIAFSSDNHLDINRVEVSAVLTAQASFLSKQRIDYYVNTGDTFNDFAKTRAFYTALQAKVGTQTHIRYLAGNHDMLRGVTYAELEQNADPLYLHNKMEVLGPDAVLIGHNGWYDYSFAPAQLTTTQLQHWKRGFWVDGVIQQPMNDQERFALALEQTAKMLTAAAGRRVFYATHFVPDIRFLDQRMLQNQKVGQYAAAFLGGRGMGNLLSQYPRVTAAFGHLHHRDGQRLLDGVTYLHSPVGYGTKRRHEWQSADFMTEWQNSLQIVEF
jgi:putative phosphoesterase